MPVSDVDIWRAAHLLIERHGEVAALMAAQRADELIEDGDVEGWLIWRRIVAAIEEWQRLTPQESHEVN